MLWEVISARMCDLLVKTEENWLDKVCLLKHHQCVYLYVLVHVFRKICAFYLKVYNSVFLHNILVSVTLSCALVIE